MASKAKPLNDELKRTFYPLAKSWGFEKLKSKSPHFAEFRRPNNNGEEIFNIQWDKYWRPYFVINFEKKNTVSPVGAGRGRLQRRRGGSMSCWFSTSRSLPQKLTSLKWRYSPREVVRELADAFYELEEWWATGEAGPHIYIFAWHT